MIIAHCTFHSTCLSFPLQAALLHHAGVVQDYRRLIYWDEEGEFFMGYPKSGVVGGTEVHRLTDLETRWRWFVSARCGAAVPGVCTLCVFVLG